MNSITNVPNVFIDEYMAAADGDAVKIYLLLLRKCSDRESCFYTSDILNKFECTEKELWHAINYLEEVNLIRVERGSSREVISVYIETALSATQNQSNLSLTPSKQYSVLGANNKEKMNRVLIFAEKCFGRKLSVKEISSIVYWNDGLKLSPELIRYCIEHCISNGHKSTYYMEKVAKCWSENNITSVEEVEKANQDYYTYSNAVKKAFRVYGRSLTPIELSYIEKWKGEMNFSCEMVQIACEKTIRMIGKPSFPYVNNILKKWVKKGISNIHDVQKEDIAHEERRFKYSRPKMKSNSFNNFDQRTYNNDELERFYFLGGSPPKTIRGR